MNNEANRFWIPASEGLPEITDDKKFMIRTYYGEVVGACSYVEFNDTTAFLFRDDNADGVWYMYYSIINVKYWAYIPEVE